MRVCNSSNYVCRKTLFAPVLITDECFHVNVSWFQLVQSEDLLVEGVTEDSLLLNKLNSQMSPRENDHQGK